MIKLYDKYIKSIEFIAETWPFIRALILFTTYHWSSNYEVSTWIDMDDTVIIQVFAWNRSFDYFFGNFMSESVQRNFVGVLGGDDNSMNSERFACSIIEFIVNCYLPNTIDKDLRGRKYKI